MTPFCAPRNMAPLATASLATALLRLCILGILVYGLKILLKLIISVLAKLALLVLYVRRFFGNFSDRKLENAKISFKSSGSDKKRLYSGHFLIF